MTNIKKPSNEANSPDKNEHQVIDIAKLHRSKIQLSVALFITLFTSTLGAICFLFIEFHHLDKKAAANEDDIEDIKLELKEINKNIATLESKIHTTDKNVAVLEAINSEN